MSVIGTLQVFHEYLNGQAIEDNEPLTEKMLDKWLKITDNKITGRYGFSSKIKDKKKFLEWANKVAPVWFLGGYGAYKVTNNETYANGGIISRK